ncbi:MAG: cell division protein ZipA C-terminal FtsZ-binding domain-containing protein [Marinicellaceae bacterium]
MTELRIIILLIGAVVLWLIYYFGTRNEKKDADTDFLNQEIAPELDLSKPRPNDLPRKNKSLSVDEALELHEKEQLNEKIITLFLHAKDGQQFDWHLIQSAAEQVGLELGQDNLYYRFNGFGENKKLVFMVANMLKPGVFQPDMRTTGLVLIMTLPGVMSALDMWDTMFPVGERIAEILGGKLTDDNHHIFSRQRIASMREEMREFDHHHSI